MSKWDWSAGLFTYVFGKHIHNTSKKLVTVDLAKSHLERCKRMTEPFKNNIEYVHMSSEEYLKKIPFKIDLLYLDTGDMTPIEDTAQLQLREAQIIVARDLMKPGGLILIDDVRNICPKMHGEKSDLGKAKYSIAYLVKNGFDVLIDEYQVLLRKR